MVELAAPKSTLHSNPITCQLLNSRKSLNGANAAHSGPIVPDVLAEVSKIIMPIAARQRGLCSFEWRIHRKHEELKSELDAWMQLHRRSSGCEIVGYEKLLKSDVHLLVSMVNPDARDEVMLPLVKQIVWFVVLDNYVDDPAHMGADAETSEELVARLMGVFRAGDAAESGDDAAHAAVSGDYYYSHSYNDDDDDDDDDGDASTNHRDEYSKAMRVIVAMGREWWADMQNAGMPVSQQRRLASVMKDYLDANVKEAEFRRRNRIPDLDTYKSLRFHAGAWLVCSVLAEFASGIDLSDRLLQHPLICSLQTAAGLHTSFANDIFSFRKELAEGNLMNLLPVRVARQLQGYNCEDQLDNDPEGIATAIVSQAVDMVKDLDEQCLRIMDDINALPLLKEERADVQKFMQGVSDWMAGTLEWYKRSARYHSD